MNIVADRYQFRARIIPEFLTVLPLVLLFISHVQNILVLGFLSFALFFVFFQGHFSSSLGRKLERSLRKSQKLESNSDYLIGLHEQNPNDQNIQNLEDAAKKANEVSPFSQGSRAETVMQIDRIVSWLIENTRDKEQFPAVFDKLCDFGFYRNMLALRVYALLTSLLAVLLFALPTITAQIFPSATIRVDHRFGIFLKIEVDTMWLALAIGWVSFWLAVITLKKLQAANKTYLATLLKASANVAVESKTTSQELKL